MQSQRQRSRKACQPCRQRKRKCDGQRPCGTCVRFEYDCYFSASERSASIVQLDAANAAAAVTSPTSSPTAPSPNKRPYNQVGVLDPYKSRFVKADSAVAFPRLLGIELSSLNAPRLHSFAWNLGVRQEPQYEKTEVVDLLSFEHLSHLLDAYFDVIHPVFHFIDEVAFRKLSLQRFSPNSKDSRVDPVICGVAALGSLFSTVARSHAKEAELVKLAKNVLEHTSTISSPTSDQVTAWILRTIYLRCTTRPHASWLSSCTTMHLIEATGLHIEVSEIAIVTPAAPKSSQSELNLRRRLFWTAKSLNKIISHEYGRSCVKLSSTNVQPVSEPNDLPLLKDRYIALANILPGDDVDPYDVEGEQALQDAVSALSRLTSLSDAITLFKADLAFSIYRRMRMKQISGHGLPVETLSLIIELGLDALPASSALAAMRLPWWTVISVPFQLVCVLLAIDSRESLLHVARAMAALEELGRHWDTHMIREAVGSAGLLVKLSKKRKEEDLKWLDEGMPKSSGPHGRLPAAAAENGESGSAGATNPGSTQIYVPTGTDHDTTAFQIPGIAMPVSLDFIDGMDIPLPEDLSIDWNTFFNTMDWN